jgi:N-methylhydantoinase A
LAALAVIEVQVSNIVSGIRKVSVEVGKDPREFHLLPFGGAGGLYAGLVAQEAGMRRILLPQHPSVLSALGMLMTDMRHDVASTRISRIDETTGEEVTKRLRSLSESAIATLMSEGLPRDIISCSFSCDMRYVGQAYEINVPIAFVSETVDVGQLRIAFDAEHNRLYGQSSKDEPVEIVNYRAGAIGRVDKAELRPLQKRLTGNPQPKSTRQILLDKADGWIECRVYDRSELEPTDQLTGPAIIEDRGSSFVLRCHHTLTVDQYGNLIVELPQS